VTVAGRPGADVPPGTLANILRQAGLKRLIREAVALHVESLRAHGEPVPPPSAVAATVVTVPAA
jgi:hypothetical protein